MELIKICVEDAERIAPLVAAFRKKLKSYKGIESQLSVEAGKEEILDFEIKSCATNGRVKCKTASLESLKYTFNISS